MTRTTAILLIAVLLPACGPDRAPEVEVPSWAKVAPEQIEEAKKHGVPVAFENDLGMRFVLIPAGTFSMGSPEDEEDRYAERLQHQVTITKPYYMRISEVTVAHFREVPSAGADRQEDERTGTSSNHPVVEVTHAEATAFAEAVSERDPGRTYHLPTEAEWEHACRAGTTTRFWWGADVRGGEQCANLRWARESSSEAGGRPERAEQPSAVGGFKPNPWGLCDMHGNVAEWASDWFAPYMTAAVRDPRGPKSGRRHVLRGGHANMTEALTGAAYRDVPPSSDYLSPWCGFRLVSPLPKPGEQGATDGD